MLYVVATPIGNLNDLSPRALETLKTADVILAEDTRVTMKLLSVFQFKTRVESCHQHNEQQRAKALVERMRQGQRFALVTDAGTPGISDPGSPIVAEAARAGIPIICIPGPSAVTSALSICGFEETEFSFFGFLPRENKAIREKLLSMAGHVRLAVMYESPHRVKNLLKQIALVFPQALVSLSCDLTKLHEKTLRGPVEAVLHLLNEDEKSEKGEYVLVLNLSPFQAVEKPNAEVSCLEARLVNALMSGLKLREAMERLIAEGEKKNAVYAASLKLKEMLENL